ncbi:N-acetylglucosamine-6-phosphate deacetylase [Arthrobacter sp. V4I6]|uniref:N-acetylglucosamine-6-phosphate deacetylase n=1 Tax=unclassified Arthrobacter TaxID=235627 RepID=UPI0027829B5F|nr:MULTISPECIES: amidohydrolase family protein [unclassified Arthrobacter]MDQ0819567.1 N-acetylglucosamine-6-phosphate deacetylase [Arthrobacter sp. V1I7]MDQ0853748.1 N-acetylglucosamine-6-phosphate deacetylase [Arthrobacter sp. V4I6]
MRADLTLPLNADGGLGLRGRLVTGRPGEETIDDGTVVVAGAAILWCGPTADLPSGIDVEIEQVPLILPGLVDVHCHGAVGHTFSADAEGARLAAAHHAAQGTTSVLASLVSAPSPVLLEQIAVLRGLVQDGTLAGLHLEGPFIAKSMCGAQDPAAIIDGDPALLTRWLEAGQGTVRSITLAPETAHFAELVQLCREYGVVPSLGHTNATAARTREALASSPDSGPGNAGPGDAGPWSATHLFNRMPPLGHRAPGPIAVLLQAARQSPEKMVVELVADGIHLDPEIVRMVFDLVGRRSIALVTDAMAAAGMPDGPYTLGRLDVLVQDRVARLAPAVDGGQPGAIAGATSRLLENVRRCVEWGIPLDDAVMAASTTPARLMDLDQVGSITEGRRADLLVTTEELELLQVYRAGTPLTQERNTRADYSV